MTRYYLFCSVLARPNQRQHRRCDGAALGNQQRLAPKHHQRAEEPPGAEIVSLDFLVFSFTSKNFGEKEI